MWYARGGGVGEGKGWGLDLHLENSDFFFYTFKC